MNENLSMVGKKIKILPSAVTEKWRKPRLGKILEILK
jgi:hypothetical protein